MKTSEEYAEVFRKHLEGSSGPLGDAVEAHGVLPFQCQERVTKNIRLFDWFSFSEEDDMNFHDVFCDIEEDHVLGEFLQIDIDDAGVMSPRLKEGVIPFAYVVDDGAEGDEWQPEGLLMLDVRDEPARVLIADIDGTIDGRNPWTEVTFESLQITPGYIPFEDEC